MLRMNQYNYLVNTTSKYNTDFNEMKYNTDFYSNSIVNLSRDGNNMRKVLLFFFVSNFYFL